MKKEVEEICICKILIRGLMNEDIDGCACKIILNEKENEKEKEKGID